jgi:membrane-associated protease RseP (regulator of RpoE activity)
MTGNSTRSALIILHRISLRSLMRIKTYRTSSYAAVVLSFGILLLSLLARPAIAEPVITEPAGSKPLMTAPQQTKEVPRVIQVKSRSAVVGLRLANISEKSGFGRAGFISGDIIKSLNGKPVRSVSEMTDSISTSETVTAVVIRNDQPIRFTFPGSPGLISDRGEEKTGE